MLNRNSTIDTGEGACPESMGTRPEAGYAASWTTEGMSGEKTVIEAEWLACTDPQKMLEFLKHKASERKLRLFACACCRRIWLLLIDQPSRDAVEVVERHVDGQARKKELKAALLAARGVLRRESAASDNMLALAAMAAVSSSNQCANSAALGMLHTADAAESEANPNGPKLTRPIFGWGHEAEIMAYVRVVYAEAHRAYCDLLRCIFGNPFRSVTISPAALAWNDAIIVRLAQTAYEERHLPEGTLDNGRLSVLADALEEAGCADADILDHLRSPGSHVRGCWTVDLCLGKS
jgi:hypothetical protein